MVPPASVELCWIVGELDAVLNRAFTTHAPSREWRGACLRYQFTPKFSIGTQFAVLKDSGGAFSRTSQTLKDTTVTGTYDIADGVQSKWEYRRDPRMRRSFSPTHGHAEKRADTAMLGVIWWSGGRKVVARGLLASAAVNYEALRTR